MKTRFLPFLVAIPCFLPAMWRLATKSFTEPIGLCSDLGLGLAIFAIAWLGPQWLRVVLLLFWALFQAMSLELLAAVGRLPSYQDVTYLLDPGFVHKSAAGFHLAEPLFVLVLLGSTMVAVLVPLTRPRKRELVAVVIIGLVLLVQANFSASHVNQSIAARYNPLHWFVADAVFQQRAGGKDPGSMTDLPTSLRTLDLEGQSLLGTNRVKNVLIIVLEGLSGIYHPEIRRKMGIKDGPFQMVGLAAATSKAMLIPDFVTHSHQTIRGLYAIHCGDVSKLSSETPKGFELQLNPQRAEKCLPARLAQNGWETHFLQGAPLQFMNKDKVMPTMGFQH
ncbi:MAG: sulfatase-like hydrolase/transferase, partial [Desulforhopalus sp.]